MLMYQRSERNSGCGCCFFFFWTVLDDRRKPIFHSTEVTASVFSSTRNEI